MLERLRLESTSTNVESTAGEIREKYFKDGMVAT